MTRLNEDQHTLSASHLPGLFAIQLCGDALAPLFNHGELLLVSREREPKKGDIVVIARPGSGPENSPDAPPLSWACGILRGADLLDKHGVCLAGFVARGYAVQGVVVSVAVEPFERLVGVASRKPRRMS